jgi:hypothetical protein
MGTGTERDAMILLAKIRLGGSTERMFPNFQLVVQNATAESCLPLEDVANESVESLHQVLRIRIQYQISQISGCPVN